MSTIYSSVCYSIINLNLNSQKSRISGFNFYLMKNNNNYSETLNNEYIERIHRMSYSSLSDNGMLQIFSLLINWLYGTL